MGIKNKKKGKNKKMGINLEKKGINYKKKGF